MDDIDVHRCRDGRLEYIGIVSFILIAITISCVLLNASAGDAVINFIILSGYSGMMIVGSQLYSVSALALLLPLLLMFVLFNYISFVYRPASESYSQRSMRMRNIQSDDGTFNRSRSRKFPGRGCGLMVLVNINNAIEYALVTFTGQRVRFQMARNAAITQRWCKMNMASSSQGMILSPGEKEYCPTRTDSIRRVTRSTRGQMFNFKNSSYVPPMQISQMLPSAKNPGEYFRDQPDFLVNAIRGQDGCILIKSGPNSHATRELHPLILFSTQEVLKRMRSQIAEISCAEKDEFLQVGVRDLCNRFEDIFETFYPDGIVMSETEKKEAYELFDLWMGEQDCQFQEITDGTLTNFIPTLSFALFEAWFSHCLMALIHSTVRDRLIAHTTRFAHVVNMRVTSRKSADERDEIQPFYSGDLGMKSLNTVTLESLLVQQQSAGASILKLSPPSNYSLNDKSAVSIITERSLCIEDERDSNRSSQGLCNHYPEDRLDALYPDVPEKCEDPRITLQQHYPAKDATVFTSKDDYNLLQRFRSTSARDVTVFPTDLSPRRLKLPLDMAAVGVRVPLDPKRSVKFMTPLAAGQDITLQDFLSQRYVTLCGQKQNEQAVAGNRSDADDYAL